MDKIQALEEQIKLLIAVEQLINSGMTKDEILDTIEIWDHDICCEIDRINQGDQS